MNLILVSGVVRSGSTWAFNVCRSLGSSASRMLGWPFGSDYLDGEPLEALTQQLRLPAVVVVKTHLVPLGLRSLVEHGHVKNVCTIRDPRDCVASRRLFKADESFRESLDLVRGSFLDAMGYGSHTLRVLYQDLLGKPHHTVQEVARYLQMDITDWHAAKIVEEFCMEAMRRHAESLSKETGAYEAHGALVDPATNLHSNHIHGGDVRRWKAELTKSQAKQVERELSDEIEWYEQIRNRRLN